MAPRICLELEGIGQHRVQRARFNPEADAQCSEEHHREAHVPGRVAWPQAGILLEEDEPRELDARVKEHACRGGRQQKPQKREMLLARRVRDHRL